MHSVDYAIRLKNPMKRGIGKDGIESVRRFEIQAIGQLELQCGEIQARLLDHGRGRVDSYRFSAAFRDQGRQVTRAASQIQDPLTRLRRQQADKIYRLLPDESILPIVQSGVPGVLIHLHYCRQPGFKGKALSMTQTRLPRVVPSLPRSLAFLLWRRADRHE
jgi:hypothetical protein